MTTFVESLSVWLTPKKAIFILLGTGFLIYFNSLFNGFVFDDEYQVVNNELIRSLTNFPQFFRGSTFYFEGQSELQGTYYKPVMTTVYSVLYTLFGLRPFFFHFFQLLMHITNAILVFLSIKYLLYQETNKNHTLSSFLAALLFLIHPINQESVAFIADLQEILFFFFGIFALLLTIKGFKILSIFPLLFLSLLSKETGILFLVLIGIYLFIYAKRKLPFYLIGATLTVGIYFILRYIVADISITRHFDSPITRLSLFERALNIPAIIFYYLKTFLFPQDLVYHQFWLIKGLNFEEFYLPLLAIALFLGTSLYVGIRVTRSKNYLLKTYLFFLLWFWVGLGFHLHIFPIDVTVADRWFYFPMAGLLGVGVVGAQTFEGKSNLFKNIGVFLLIVIIIALSSRTIIRNFDWRDTLTLFTHDVKLAKDPYDLEYGLAVELGKRERYDEAIAHLINLTRSPRHIWPNWYYIGLFYEKKGDVENAKKALARAVEESKKTDRGPIDLAYEKLAILMLYQDEPKETKLWVKEALQRLPENPKLWLVLALAEYKLKNSQEALIAARRAYNLLPDEESYYILSQLEQNLPIEFK